MIQYSFGELVDKLAVIHLKIWHLEEEVASRKNEPADEDLEKILDQIVNLNTTRVKIVQSLDELWEEKCGPA